MAISVEFYGIPRLRAGVEHTSVLPNRPSSTMSEVLSAVARELPAFAQTCMERGQLRDGYVASIDGESFTRSSDAVVTSGQSVLILSADAGG